MSPHLDDEDLLARARIARQGYIHLLSICNCPWPLVILGNATRHDEDCPAHHEMLRMMKEVR
jgi:hypothetical protein